VFPGYCAVDAAYLVLAATQHDALQSFSAAMLGFVLPLTGVTLLVLSAQHR
jgi:cation:H+ antiporter